MLRKFDGIPEGFAPSEAAYCWARDNVSLAYETHPLPTAPTVKGNFRVVRVFGIIVYFLLDDFNSFEGSARYHEDTWLTMLQWMYDKGMFNESISTTD